MAGNNEWFKVTCIFKENLYFAQNNSNGLLLCPISAHKSSLNLFIRFDSKSAQIQKFHNTSSLDFSEILCDDSHSKGSKSGCFHFSIQLWLCQRIPVDVLGCNIDIFLLLYWHSLVALFSVIVLHKNRGGGRRAGGGVISH